LVTTPKQRIPDGVVLAGGAALIPERSTVEPFADFATAREDYLRARSANFRQQVRRRARRLSGALGVRFRLTQDRDRLAADMDALIGLHAARWGSQSRAFNGLRKSFHHELAATALERGWLRLWLAEADGGPAAA
jgi:hypothetical protein